LTYRYIFLIAALLLLIAGCASVKTETSAESAAAAAQEQPAPVESENKAVIALLDLAHTDNEAGRREAAGASLERALRIEPRNPWLWHELAQLRLTQGQYEQAISMARKSNSFAGQDRRLQALNWRAIGDARVAQGDSAGAEQALKQAAELEQSQ
jgi:tetratricopeptide (TPR) repeat protein